MLKLLKKCMWEKLGKDPRLATLGLCLAISFVISMIVGTTILEAHQAFAGGIPEPTHR